MILIFLIALWCTIISDNYVVMSYKQKLWKTDKFDWNVSLQDNKKKEWYGYKCFNLGYIEFFIIIENLVCKFKM